jgi:D-sedoheptulose 7-phosphate isomerase
MAAHSIKENFQEAQHVLNVFLSDELNFKKIEAAGLMMVESMKNGGKVISCGNGGSMCDAMHFAEELSGKFRQDRPALAALSISDPSHMSCVGNDYGYEFVFSRFIEGLGNRGDVLLAISSSGNSKNVVLAMQAARMKGMKVVALTGKDGGQMASLCEIHIKVIHSLIHFIEQVISSK